MVLGMLCVVDYICLTSPLHLSCCVWRVQHPYRPFLFGAVLFRVQLLETTSMNMRGAIIRTLAMIIYLEGIVTPCAAEYCRV